MGFQIRLVKHLFLSLSTICLAFILVEIDTVINSPIQRHVMKAKVSLHSGEFSANWNQTISTNGSATASIQRINNTKTSINATDTSRYPPTNQSSVILRTITTSTLDISRPVAQSDCSTKANLAFIKTHKTGSTTLRSIINRFGLARNLSFVFLKESKNGHMPYYRLTDSLRKRFLPPIGVRSGNSDALRGYNLSNVHLRFSRKFFDTFMANGTKYITILRDPVHQWLSVISFFGMKRYLPSGIRKSSFENVAAALAVNAKQVRTKMRNSNRHYFQNNQIFDLGLSEKNYVNEAAVVNYVSYLDDQLDLVLINEYFDESLVLLRKLMCWDWDDIVYIARNIQSSKHTVRNETINAIIRRNNFADQYLYDFFNKTLWTKVEEYGDDFFRDLEYFRNLSAKVYADCSLKDVVIHGKVHHTFKNHSSGFCVEVQADNQLRRIKERQQITTKKDGGKTAEIVGQHSKQSVRSNDTVIQQKISVPNVDIKSMLGENLGNVAVPLSKKQKEETLACERDPKCQRVVFEKQTNGKIKMLKFIRTRKGS